MEIAELQHLEIDFKGYILCKRMSKTGPYQYTTVGEWYKVLDFEKNNGSVDMECFHIIDDMGKRHCFYWSNVENSPRSYLKWFHHYSRERDLKISQILD